MEHLKSTMNSSTHLDKDRPTLENLIHMMEKDGMIESKIEDGEKKYAFSEAGKAVMDILLFNLIKDKS